MSDYSIYPKAIDGYAQIPLVVDKKSPINAESVNRLRSGIINIEKAIGVAPEFSDEFGSFPDLTSRLNSLESQFIEETSLTALYERDNILWLDEEPLVFSAPDGSSLDLGNFDEKFFINSSTGIELQAGGTLPSMPFPEAPGLSFSWPSSIAIKKSEMIPFPFAEPEGDESPHIGTYLTLGGQINESDLAILKFEDINEDSGGMVSLIVGANAAMDIEKDPVSLAIQCLESLKSGVDGGSISMKAGGVDHEFDSAGSVSIESGHHPHVDGSSITVRAPGVNDDGILKTGGITLNGGGFNDGGAGSGAVIKCGETELGEGGNVEITAGEPNGAVLIYGSEDPWGKVELNGTNININGNMRVLGGFAPAIRKHMASMHGNSCVLQHDDHTVITDANFGAQITVFLPPPSPAIAGRVYNVKRADDVNSTQIICPGGGQFIDNINGNIGIELTNPWDGVTLQTDGNDWFILSRTG